MELDFDFQRMHLAALLRRDAGLHRLGRHDLIGLGLPQVCAQLDDHVAQRYLKLVVAVSFWGAWVVARNTGWREHEHVAVGSWPALAERVAECLERNRDITDPEIIRAYDVVTPSRDLPRPPSREACLFGPDAIEAYDFSSTDYEMPPAPPPE
ncbi:MAG: hypothetical protein HY749_04530 [Gammaproteobacteria bacterium]|nr:hypothetical protein [Gammaproteobacteria bacterium]MBI5617602.1 hypothetical protein [Gammaproteobacteria bacterium]